MFQTGCDDPRVLGRSGSPVEKVRRPTETVTDSTGVPPSPGPIPCRTQSQPTPEPPSPSPSSVVVGVWRCGPDVPGPSKGEKRQRKESTTNKHYK